MPGPTKITATRSRLRPHGEVSPKLEKTLLSYVSAAGAACALSLMSIPAQAEVIYKSAHVVLQPNKIGSFDINADGVSDFSFFDANQSRIGRSTRTFYITSTFFLNGRQPGNAMVVSSAFSPCAVKLQSNQTIGPNNYFLPKAQVFDGCNSWGPAPQKGYLGFKFSISGETHYGWMRLITFRNGIFRDVKIGGYAYEYDADTPIVVNQQPGGDSSVLGDPKPAGLGHLAAGTVGLKARKP